MNRFDSNPEGNGQAMSCHATSPFLLTPLAFSVRLALLPTLLAVAVSPATQAAPSLVA